MKKYLLFFSIVIILTSTGCYYDKKELMYPNGNNSPCDTTNMSYSKDIANIIVSNNCLSCHSSTTSNAGNGVVLDNYSDFSNMSNAVVNDIQITDLTSPNHMPFGMGMISSCDINKIIAWVNQGAKNN